ncbi:MAG: lipopolysaccharide assembly LapA domain-containing protein [Mangrovibacterium sp.]
MSAGVILILILAMLLVVFTLQNSMAISLKIFFWELNDVPLVLTLVVCIFAGFLIAFCLYAPRIWKMKSAIRGQQKQIEELRRKEAENTFIPAPKRSSFSDDTEITGGNKNTGFFN